MLGQKLYKNNAEAMDIYPSVAEWCNNNNAHIEDKGEYYEVVAVAPYVSTKEEQVTQLKAELASYDYIGTKIAMGVATKEEYADKIAYTETLRAKINELQN